MKKCRVKLFSMVVGLLLLFGTSGPFIQAQGLNGGDNTGYEPENPGIKSEQTATGGQGMVVSAHPSASKVGADVLEQGGNAVDAAVAMQFALNVAEPMMSGIGGGGFMMVYDADKEDVSIIDSRERAPEGATPDMFMDKTNTVKEPGKFLLSAIESNNDGGGQFHVGQITVDNLDHPDDHAFSHDFNGEEGEPWDAKKFDLFERGTNFRIDKDGGQIKFGPAVNGNKTSFARSTAKMQKLKNSELTLRFRTDDPGDDRRLRVWLRADGYRSGSTFAKNGYGIEINSNTNEVKLIQSKDSKSSYLKTIKYDTAAEWQSLKFRVNGDSLKVKLWTDGTKEPDAWNIATEAGSVIPFSERVQMGQAAGVPGTLKGLETALDKWGTRSLNDLIQPAVKMADQGVKVNWVLADAIESNQEKLSRSAAKDVFLPDGKPLKEGDLLVQKDLADTFRLIGTQGSDVYYKGEIGSALAQVVQQFGGSMTADDLKKYDVTEDKPLWGNYQGYDIASMPPPSSGGLTVLQLLKMFEDLDLTKYDVRSPEKYHYMTEAMHLAYADRAAYMGDPEYVDVPMKGLLNPDYIKKRAASIDADKANPDAGPGNPWDYQGGAPSQIVEQNDQKVDGETTHFTVADKWGNMVSYTTTNEQLFGTGIMVPGYGIILNNELTDFDAVPGGSNEVQPNKRPLSSMSPSMVFKEDKPYMTVGSPGGTTIISSVAQTILNSIGYGMDLKDAIEEPRIYSNAYPEIRWEYGVPDNVRKQLKQMGHVWEAAPKEIGNVNSIMIDQEKGVYHGAADSTREGMAIGIEDLSVSYMKTLVERLQSEDDISKNAANALNMHLTAIAHFEQQKSTSKAIKHMEGFKRLLEHHKKDESISKKAYDLLKEDADQLIQKWQQ